MKRGLWFSLVAPALAFGAEGAFGWWIGNWMCASRSFATGQITVGVVTLAMLAVAVTGLMSGLSNYRSIHPAQVAADRLEFMALGGVIVSASFVVGLIWFGLSAAFVHHCGGMR